MTMMAADHPKKTSKGKQKISMSKIEKLQSRHVAFSKRRPGLFKKCSQLHSLFGVDVAAFTFSIAGKPISCGYPSSADSVLERYIRDCPSAAASSSCSENAQVSTFLDHDHPPSNWWDKSIDNLGLEDLEEFKTALEGLKKEVDSKLVITRNEEAEIFEDLGSFDSNIDGQIDNAPECMYSSHEPQPQCDLDFGWIDDFLESQTSELISDSFPAAAGMIGCC